MKEKVSSYIRAGYPALYILSHEEQRVQMELAAVAKALKFSLYFWTPTRGIMDPAGKQGIPDTEDPISALNAFDKLGDMVILLMQDFHMFLADPNPILYRRIKEALLLAKSSNRVLIILGCLLKLPPELEKEITVVELKLPGRQELMVVLEGIAQSAKKDLNGNTDALLDAASGLTTTEAEAAFALSVVEKGDLVPAVIAREKASTIKKGGILEIIEPGVTFDHLGGLSELKRWVNKRKNAFTKAAVDYGLPVPRGICLFGVQGCGKSYGTRAIASELDCPLIRLDAGRLFGGLVGSSEANVRAVIAQVEAFGKCVLQIEEIDKGFAGMVGGHDGDSGTTRRVIGTFLTWMAEKTSPVFIVATANDLTKLPPELLRKGRWDELFFIDLPTTEERVEIWRVQIARHNRKPKGYELPKLANATEGWTGAEIEALFNEGLYEAFEHDTEPTTASLLVLSKETVPLSKTMAQSVNALRDWSKGRARQASAARKLIAA